MTTKTPAQKQRLIRRRFSRRDFVKLGALAASAVSHSPLAGQTSELSRKGPRKRVIIMGAGLAGLSAAYELDRAGHDVAVLEAQVRPGGRVETLRSPFSDGLYAETGAARIPDNHDLTLKYVKAFGLSLTPFYPEDGDYLNVVRGQPAQRRNPSDESEGTVAEDNPLGSILKEVGNPSAPEWPGASLLHYDEISVLERLRQLGLSDKTISTVVLGAASLEDLGTISALYALRQRANELTETTKFKIEGGNDQLPKEFARRLSDRIRYGAGVTGIKQDPDRVEVFYEQLGASRKLAGDYLVCTLPFPVLRAIRVEPEFSPGKQRAIEELQYGSVTRSLVQVSQRFWKKSGANGFARTDDPAEVWHATWDQPGPRGVLAFYLRGKRARLVAQLDRQRQEEFVLNQLGRVHPGLRDYAENIVTKIWNKDRWAKGAYFLARPGQMAELYPHVATPEGRVFFAGEHTSPWPTWMQGALQSGVRAAREVNDAV